MNDFLAIIPARGNSKRLKNKNILKLNNKPLIAYSIELAQKTGIDFYVNSEDRKILKIARKFKAKTIKRKKTYSLDTSPTYLAIIEAIKKLNRIGKKYKYLILLQPTSPLRSIKDLKQAIKLFLKKRAKAVISISKPLHSPLWSFRIKNNNLKNIFNKTYFNKRSQDLPTFYQINGAIYIIKIDYFLKYKTFLLNKGIFGYNMNEINSIDIDNLIDFKLCEVIIKEKLWK